MAHSVQLASALESRDFAVSISMNGARDFLRAMMFLAIASVATLTAAGPPTSPDCSPSPCNIQMTYFGGPVISNVEVVQVHWTGAVSNPTASSMASFFREVVYSPYLDWLSEYNTNITGFGGVAGTNQRIGRGTFAGVVTITPGGSHSGTTLSDSDISSEIAAQIAANKLPPPSKDASGNTNTYYAVFFPPGYTIHDPSGGSSCQTFCSYHSAATSGSNTLYYGVHPDFGVGSGCDVGCGNGSTLLQNLTMNASRTLVETITDPQIGLAATGNAPPVAWIDGGTVSQGEIGDMCNQHADTITSRDGTTTYTVQQNYSRYVDPSVACVTSRQAGGLVFTLAATPNPANVGQTVMLTASKSDATGTVMFYDDDNRKLLGVANLTNGAASFSTSSLALGNHRLAAAYGGDSGQGGLFASTVVTVQASLPAAPTVGTATPGDGQLTIAFTPPVETGGIPLSGFVATCNPGNFQSTGNASPLVVGGLSNGAPYTCSVAAINATGTGPDSATVGGTPYPPLALASVMSRKMHGTAGPFDLIVDTSLIAPAVTVEPRTIGNGHQIVFQFNQPITGAGALSVVDGSTLAAIGSAIATASANEVVVTLTNIPDAKRINILLTGVAGGNGVLNPSANIGFLIGDTNNSRRVEATDVSAVKARSGQSVTQANFRYDLNISGIIGASDIAAVKAHATTTLP